MRVLALGGNGFIGSHVVAALVDAGHRVVVVDRTVAPRFPHGRPFEYAGSGTADAIAALPRTDLLCHLAYSTVPATANADPVADIAGNLSSSVALLEAMRAAGRRRIVYLSSGGAVYGLPRMVPIPEDHPLDPISAYGVSKVAFEKYLGMYAAVYGFTPTIIRPSNPYGPGQGKVGLVGVVNTFLRAALIGEPVRIWGDGTAVRDYIYVADVAALVLHAVADDRPGVYNCGCGVGSTLLELASTIEQLTGQKIEKTFVPARKFDPPSVVLDVGRAAESFGWVPCVGLAEGLVRTRDWLVFTLDQKRYEGSRPGALSGSAKGL